MVFDLLASFMDHHIDETSLSSVHHDHVTSFPDIHTMPVIGKSRILHQHPTNFFLGSLFAGKADNCALIRQAQQDLGFERQFWAAANTPKQHMLVVHSEPAYRANKKLEEVANNLSCPPAPIAAAVNAAGAPIAAAVDAAANAVGGPVVAAAVNAATASLSS